MIQRGNIVNSTTARRLRVVGALALSAALVGTLAACSTPSSKPTTGGTYTLWDPYPDRDASSTWAKAVDACATQVGVTIKRTASNTGDTVKDLTTAASNLPDVPLFATPKASTRADPALPPPPTQ